MSFKTLMASLTKQCGTIGYSATDLTPSSVSGSDRIYVSPGDGFFCFCVYSNGYYVQKAGTVMGEAHFTTNGHCGCTIPVKKGESILLNVSNYTSGRLDVRFFKLNNSS